jgi:Protein of unknown function (DUF1573)
MKASLLIFGYYFLLFPQLIKKADAQSIVLSEGAAISIEKPTFEFGTIYEGDKVQHAFKFTNSGNKPLIITNVEVTCGCTVPKGWPRDPIMPGDRAELQVQFNSAGKVGKQSKVVTIVSNSVTGNTQLTISATVVEKKRE